VPREKHHPLWTKPTAEGDSRPPAGWVRVDCHVHTIHSGDAVTTLDELEARVEAVGIDVVCITDHHEIKAAVEALERDLGVRVIIGEEIRTPIGELIGLFLNERIPYVLPQWEVVSRIRSQGGIVYVPHPYDPIRDSLRQDGLREMCESGGVDAIEAFNAKVEEDHNNRLAWDVARRYELPVGCGSDAHDPHGLGAAWVEMPDFDGPADFLSSLASGRLVGEYRPHARRFLPRPNGAAALAAAAVAAP
jgi:predicted metal-dependent phosphoesterase TrpH